MGARYTRLETKDSLLEPKKNSTVASQMVKAKHSMVQKANIFSP